MLYIVTINNKSYEVEVEHGQANIVKIDDTAAQAAVQAAQVAASIPAAPQAQAPAAPAPAAPVVTVSGNGQPVKSPMPGTILDVRVSGGQAVKKGDVLFILEAMKMENEIMSPVDGVISQVATSKGASVSTGDILAIIQ